MVLKLPIVPFHITVSFRMTDLDILCSMNTAASREPGHLDHNDRFMIDVNCILCFLNGNSCCTMNLNGLSRKSKRRAPSLILEMSEDTDNTSFPIICSCCLLGKRAFHFSSQPRREKVFGIEQYGTRRQLCNSVKLECAGVPAGEECATFHILLDYYIVSKSSSSSFCPSMGSLFLLVNTRN